MSSFGLAKMSLRNLFRKPATKGYPAVPAVFTERSKGTVRNDMDTCILCGICQKRCPTNAIVVDKPGGTWTVNDFDCIQCLSCVRSCPKKSLTMDPQYAAPAGEMSAVTLCKTNEDAQE
ncbi:MAG: 4Fe-4S binding protein [Coriobacteriales bacterium]|jgi:formate hydrogenlyase subunit 6/NADH:ubiquinone oxidoreductase subunit I|nr:4Fe-4S binding protein [Coriobacteriales bacterium]